MQKNNTKQRRSRISISATVFAAALIVAGFVFSASVKTSGKVAAVETTEIWDGSVAVAFAGGNGTKSDPYLISDGAEFAFFVEVINSGEEGYNTADIYYKLVNDIYLNDISGWESWASFANAEEAEAVGIKAWTPIGTGTSFRSNFDGAGHAVRGVYIHTRDNQQGLFGRVFGGSISNTGVEQSYIKGRDDVGGVAGVVGGGGQIINSYHAGEVVGMGSGAGGVAGNIYNSGITGSYNTGSVTGGSYVGGVAGHIFGGVITGSYNTGKVAGTGTAAGGVAGAVFNTDDNDGRISDSYNIGNVTGGMSVGGVVGAVSGGSIVKCKNSGGVFGDYHVGGIAGMVMENGSLTDCNNEGNVTGEMNVGGIVGFIIGNRLVKNCKNTGVVTGKSDGYIGCLGGTVAIVPVIAAAGFVLFKRKRG